MQSTMNFAALHNAGLPHELVVGSEVGSQRWPYSCSHPDCWETPHKGVILDHRDPRAWARTLWFASDLPSQKDVDERVYWCYSQGLLNDYLPVLWHFPGGSKVLWSQVKYLVPAELDYQNWLRARAAAYAREPSSRQLQLVA